MPRFGNLLGCLGSCDWSCCELSPQISIIRNHFWKSLDEKKDIAYTFHSSEPPFIYEKVIHLNNGKNIRSTFSIGLDPENKFEIGGRLEMCKSGVILRMNYNQMNSFMEFLKDYENQILRTLPIEDIAAEYNIQIRKTQAFALDVNMNGCCINIDEDSLIKMCRMRTYIQEFISSLRIMSLDCEESFFKLLNHFNYGKTFREACDLAETEHNRMFLNEVVTFHCNCLDKKFVIEIATHFEQWFAKCVPYFWDTLMQNESARLQTFSSTEWPHDQYIVDVNKMAKSGFFFVGTSDQTQCAFCKVLLQKWEAGDDPIEEHFKYKPSCQFLMSLGKSLDVSELGKLSSVWKTKKSFDEVDL